jgi:hypothetical protein
MREYKVVECPGNKKHAGKVGTLSELGVFVDHSNSCRFEGLYNIGPGLYKNANLTMVAEIVEPTGCSGVEAIQPGQAFKEDDGKPNWYLLMSAKGCASALAGVVRVLSFAVRAKDKGGKGYIEHSWREVPNGKERYEAALYRHLSKVHLGELVDDESGESHWAHIATNALFLAELHKSRE